METAFQTDAFQQQQLAFQTNTSPASGPVPVEVADTYRPLEEITGKYGGG